MAKRRQPMEHQTSLDGAIDDAKNDVEALHEEIGDWKSNMESNNMEALPKFEEVSDCESALDDVHQALDGIEVPDLPEGFEDVVKWTMMPPKRKGRQTRSERASDVSAALDAAASAIESFLDEHDDDHECWKEHDNRQAFEDLMETLREAESGISDVSFPSMY